MPKTVREWVAEHPLCVSLAAECDGLRAELELLREALRAADLVHRMSSAITEGELRVVQEENESLRLAVARIEHERLKVVAEHG